MSRRWRVCVCGGGSVAHVLAAVLGAREEVETRVLTRRPQDWHRKVRIFYRDEAELVGEIDLISSCPEDAVAGADIVILTLPSCARPEVLARIRNCITEETWVGSFPGFGGFDWVARAILGERVCLFGTQRVPYVCKKIQYGSSVLLTGIRPQTYLAALPNGRVAEVAQAIGNLLHTRVIPMSNYLCVSLSQSNPVFHPARLYSLFQNWKPGRTYEQRFRFYEDWDDAASEIFGKCDAEIMSIGHQLPLDMAYLKPIVQHYEVARQEELTAKIRSIKALHGRYVPLLKTEAGYVLDLQASYFTEDIPYGLLVLRGIAEVVGVDTPTMDEILKWAERLQGVHYLVDGTVTRGDTADLPIPQNFGITTIEQLVARAI